MSTEKKNSIFRFGSPRFDDEGVTIFIHKNGMPIYVGIALYCHCGTRKEALARAVQECVDYVRTQRPRAKALRDRIEKAIDAEFRAILPTDYEECGYCGFDHEYEYESAKWWHEENDPEGELYK